MRNGRSVGSDAANKNALVARSHRSAVIIRNETLAVIPPTPVPLYKRPRKAIGRAAFYLMLATIFCVTGYCYRDPDVRKAIDYRMTLAFSPGLSSISPIKAGSIAPKNTLPLHASYLFMDGQKGPRADKFLYGRKASAYDRTSEVDSSENLGVARRTKTASLYHQSGNTESNTNPMAVAGAVLYLTAVNKIDDNTFGEHSSPQAVPNPGKSEWPSLLRNASLSPDQPQSSTLFGGLTEDEFRMRELRCMATAIYFEARDEPVKGQIAVGQVIMNRVRSQFYPKTICGVIYQGERLRTGCQFSFTCTGKKLRVREKQEWINSVKVAKQVIAREVWLDEIGHATHYHATYVKPTWRHELDRVAKIGEHIFYKMKPGKIQLALLAEGL